VAPLLSWTGELCSSRPLQSKYNHSRLRRYLCEIGRHVEARLDGGRRLGSVPSLPGCGRSLVMLGRRASRSARNRAIASRAHSVSFRPVAAARRCKRSIKLVSKGIVNDLFILISPQLRRFSCCSLDSNCRTSAWLRAEEVTPLVSPGIEFKQSKVAPGPSTSCGISQSRLKLVTDFVRRQYLHASF